MLWVPFSSINPTAFYRRDCKSLSQEMFPPTDSWANDPGLPFFLPMFLNELDGLVSRV